ncbi:hypothetical protein SRHO_G00197900 [Serrasalmus rhombeus]
MQLCLALEEKALDVLVDLPPEQHDDLATLTTALWRHGCSTRLDTVSCEFHQNKEEDSTLGVDKKGVRLSSRHFAAPVLAGMVNSLRLQLQRGRNA